MIYILFILTLFLYWCEKSNEIGDIYNVQSKIYKVSKWVLTWEIEYIWTVESNNQSMIWSPIWWKVIKLYYNEWDYVKAWSLLAELDPNILLVNIQSADNMLQALQNMYEATSNMFDSQISAMEEKLKQAEVWISQSLIMLKWAETWLIDVKNISESQLETAKKQIEQAEVAMETALKNYENTKEIFNQKKQDIISSSKSLFSQSRLLITNFFDFIDSILWITEKRKIDLYNIDPYIWAKDANLKNRVKIEYYNYNKKFKEVSEKLDKSNNLEDVYNALIILLEYFESLRKYSDDIYKVIDLSITSNYLTLDNINNIKSKIVEFQKNIESIILNVEWSYVIWIKWLIQAIENIQKEEKAQLDMLYKQYEIAKTQYETAKSTYNQYVNVSSGQINEVSTKKDTLLKQYEIALLQKEEILKSINSLKKQKEAQLKQILTQIEQIKWNKDQALVQLNYTKVYAPFDWIIIKKHAEIWQVVWPWIPIFSISSNSNLVLKVFIPSEEIKYLSGNIKAYINWKIYDVKVHKIYPILDYISKRVPVEFKVDANLKIWDYVRLKIEIWKYEWIIIPKNYIKYEYWRAFVYLKDKSKVYIDIKCKDNVCITNDLKEWDEILY